MSKKGIFSIVIIVIIIAVAVWVSITPKTPAGTTPGSTTTKNSGLSSLFPFSNKETPTLEQQGSSTTQQTTTTTVPTAEKAPARITTGPLVQVANRLIAGITILPPRQLPSDQAHSAKTFGPAVVSLSTSPTVRFVERGTGYIYDIDATGQNENKVSGTTIIRANKALFADNGNTVIIQYVKNDNSTLVSYLGHLVAPSAGNSTGDIKGDFLPDNLYDVGVSPDGKNIFYLLPIDNGLAGISAKTDNTSKKELFSSAFTEWLLDVSKNGVTVTTKPASDYPGYSYKILVGGAFQRILGGINGLTTKMSPDGSTLLYSIGEVKGLHLHSYQIKSESDTDIGLTTLPEKCVWSKDSTTVYCGSPDTITYNAYPDDWYQGIFHFNDSIWKINIKTGVITKLSTGESNNLDAINLMLDSSEKFLLFTNKTDGSLWSLDLTKAQK
jgi:hypothetical protein